MLFIIPIQAISIEEVIQVDGESGVAEYFLTKDSAATPSQKIVFAVASDFVLNVLFGIVTVNPRRLVSTAYLLRTEGRYVLQLLLG